MSNLLKETLELLERNNKKETDVKWVGTTTHKTTWKISKKIIFNQILPNGRVFYNY